MVSQVVSIAVAVPIETQAPEAQPALKTHVSVRIIGGEFSEKIEMLPGLKACPGQNAGGLNAQRCGPFDQEGERKVQTIPGSGFFSTGSFILAPGMELLIFTMVSREPFSAAFCKVDELVGAERVLLFIMAQGKRRGRSSSRARMWQSSRRQRSVIRS